MICGKLLAFCKKAFQKYRQESLRKSSHYGNMEKCLNDVYALMTSTFTVARFMLIKQNLLEKKLYQKLKVSMWFCSSKIFYLLIHNKEYSAVEIALLRRKVALKNFWRKRSLLDRIRIFSHVRGSFRNNLDTPNLVVVGKN